MGINVRYICTKCGAGGGGPVGEKYHCHECGARHSMREKTKMDAEKNLIGELQKHCDVEEMLGSEMFFRKPGSWWDDRHVRCINDHVSTTTLKSEHLGGDVCLVCMEHVYLTFPEDKDGLLMSVEDRMPIQSVDMDADPNMGLKWRATFLPKETSQHRDYKGAMERATNLMGDMFHQFYEQRGKTIRLLIGNETEESEFEAAMTGFHVDMPRIEKDEFGGQKIVGSVFIVSSPEGIEEEIEKKIFGA